MPSTKVKINNVHVRMIIDTGASTNIIDDNTFALINKRNPTLLKRTRTKLFACIWFQTTTPSDWEIRGYNRD